MSGEGERLTFISRHFWRDKCHVCHTCKFWEKRTLERALLSYCDMDNLQVLVSMSTTYCPVWYYYPNQRRWWANDKHLSIMLLPPTTIRINKKTTVNYRVWLRCPRLSMVGHVYVSEYNIARDNIMLLYKNIKVGRMMYICIRLLMQLGTMIGLYVCHYSDNFLSPTTWLSNANFSFILEFVSVELKIILYLACTSG